MLGGAGGEPDSPHEHQDSVCASGGQAGASTGGGASLGDAAPLNSYMEFLSDDLIFGAEGLDAATLDAVCQLGHLPHVHNPPAGPAGGGAALGGEAGPSCATGPAGGPGCGRRLVDQDSSDSDDDDGRVGPSGGKRGRSEMSVAATKKACREKARREKLNDRFVDLAKLVDPGNEPKTDKTTILTDAIRYVQQVTVENHQLKQLNKFLEERVASYERERGQQLYQQSLLMQQMQQQMQQQVGAPQAQQGLMLAQGMMLAPAGTIVPAGMAMAHTGLMAGAAPGLGVPSGLLTAASGVGLPSSSTPPPLQPQQQQQQQQLAAVAVPGQPGIAPGGNGAATAAAAPAPGAVSLGAGHVGKGPMMMMGPAGMMQLQYPAGAGGMYWLPPQVLDSSQDSLLRPPAA